MFRQHQRVIDLYSPVKHRVFELAVAEEQLTGPRVSTGRRNGMNRLRDEGRRLGSGHPADGPDPGDVILTGSFIRAFPVKAGDEILCRFDQGLGDVATAFI